MNLHVGLSGYSYKEWQGEGKFYPKNLKQNQFLEYYATQFDAVELDGTWYRMPSEKMVSEWNRATPEGFQFCPKAHRDITHIMRLHPESIRSLQFMLSRLEPLKKAHKLGPILIQLPPNLKRKEGLLENFLKDIPEGVWAIEFRHDSWNIPEVENLLRSYEIAWAMVETDEKEAMYKDTARFVYVRLRKSDYSDKELKDWAKRLKSIGKDCYVFCKHEEEVTRPWEWGKKLLKYFARL
ncbi:MAG TPA: DUF72 domain-containing protein [Fimbriimonadales bacterium]|nr:DUF72 domain-containing protein [Fimbriimonadales bacterium]